MGVQAVQRTHLSPYWLSEMLNRQLHNKNIREQDTLLIQNMYSGCPVIYNIEI